MKQTVLALCGVSLLFFAADSLSLRGSMKKAVRFVCALGAMLTLLTALHGRFWPSLSRQAPQNEESQSRAAAWTAEQLCEKLLTGENLAFRKVSARADILPDGSISISEVQVISDADPAAIRQALREIPAETVEVAPA